MLQDCEQEEMPKDSEELQDIKVDIDIVSSTDDSILVRENNCNLLTTMLFSITPALYHEIRLENKVIQNHGFEEIMRQQQQPQNRDFAMCRFMIFNSLDMIATSQEYCEFIMLALKYIMQNFVHLTNKHNQQKLFIVLSRMYEIYPAERPALLDIIEMYFNGIEKPVLYALSHELVHFVKILKLYGGMEANNFLLKNPVTKDLAQREVVEEPVRLANLVIENGLPLEFVVEAGRNGSVVRTFEVTKPLSIVNWVILAQKFDITVQIN